MKEIILSTKEFKKIDYKKLKYQKKEKYEFLWKDQSNNSSEEFIIDCNFTIEDNKLHIEDILNIYGNIATKDHYDATIDVIKEDGYEQEFIKELDFKNYKEEQTYKGRFLANLEHSGGYSSYTGDSDYECNIELRYLDCL